MKIASWNVNSVRVRAKQLSNFLISEGIDICLLQEIKCVSEAFPTEYFEDLGYNACVFGQKAYNGVAILSRYIIEETVTGAEVFEDDYPNPCQARYIEALINGHTVASVYVPNGVAPGSDQYYYKLRFLNILKNHIRSNNVSIIGGDFNIALTDYDVYDPKLWHEKICCTELERKCLHGVIDDLELIDALRRKYNNNERIYTWWNYKFNSYSTDKGLRLDYIFLTSDIQFQDAYVARSSRNLERPSDHAPVVVLTSGDLAQDHRYETLSSRNL